MKKVLLIAGLVLALAVGVSAQDAAKKMNFYLGAGGSLPMGDFGDAYGTGLHGTGALGFTVAPGFQILGKVEFHTFGIDEEFLAFMAPDGATDLDGGDVSMLMFGADGKYNFPTQNSKMSPYLIGGLGIASISVKDITGTFEGESFTGEVDSESKVYFEIGAGVELASSPSMSFFLQGRYVSVSTEGSSSTFIPLTLGLRF